MLVERPRISVIISQRQKTEHCFLKKQVAALIILTSRNMRRLNHKEETLRARKVSIPKLKHENNQKRTFLRHRNCLRNVEKVAAPKNS